MRCFILTPTYRIVNGIPEVHLYGILESGEPCLLIDDRVRPYFFVRARDRDKVCAAMPSARISAEALTTFAGEPVVQVEVGLPGDVPPLRRRLDDVGVECFEADIRFAYRYMIDHGLRGSVEVDGPPHQRHERIGNVYRNPTLRPCQWKPPLRVLSIDIETSMKGDRVWAIALHGCGQSKSLLVHHDHSLADAEVVPNEHALLSRFLGYFDVLDPDVITGWNVIDFDLAVLARAARRHGLRFAIGRTDDEFDRQRDPSFTRESRAVLYGRLVLDGLALMRGAFIRLDDYKLETAAQEFLGRGKLITGAHRHLEIDRLYREDPQALVNYNLEDARLVSDILDRTGLIELAIERSLLTGMPLDRVSAAIASADSLYLGDLRRRGLVAPSVGNVTAAEIMGGYVMDSQPGLYRNVMVFDFKSLYPSIIRTFNLDPVSLLRNDTDDRHAITAPNGARFRRSPAGILPALVATLAAERQEARKAGQGVKSNAIKILMNSLYGVLGAGASRLFSPPVANAITHFGQLLIRTAAEYATERGFRVLYGDTDSLFIDAAEDDPARALQLAEHLRQDIGAFVTAEIRAKYACESFLELEFEKLYHRFFLPELRGGKGGSKKRYAGLLVNQAGEEQIEFVGLESKRRDWTDVSKRFQAGLLMRVFHDQPVIDFIRTFIADLHAGRFDGELVYRKAIRKALTDYTKTTPPHVQAARKQQGPSSRLVEYIVTRNGPEPFGEATAPLDYEHYVEHQLKPIADAILLFLGTDFDTVTLAKKQLSLF